MAFDHYMYRSVLRVIKWSYPWYSVSGQDEYHKNVLVQRYMLGIRVDSWDALYPVGDDIDWQPVCTGQKLA